MFPMDPSAYPGIAFANPDAATALATAALVDVTTNLVGVTNHLVIVSLVIGLGQIAAIVYGIWSMNQSGKRRAREHDQRHKEAMTALHSLIRKSQPRTRRAVLRPSP